MSKKKQCEMRSKDQFLLSLLLGSLAVYTIVKSFRSCSQLLLPSSTASLLDRNSARHGQVSSLPSLAATELPGYTGWARPSYSLASRFRIKERDDDVAVAGRNWTVTVTCDGCSKQAVWFYARAYGPAILTGVVERHIGSNNETTNGDNIDDYYTVTFHPVVPGQYTVEVVLTFSHPIDPDLFPLVESSLQPNYEGYLLPMFPLQLIVAPKSESLTTQNDDDVPYCSVDDLTMTEQSIVSNPMWRRASWRVVATSRDNATQAGVITRNGYALGHNSLGFTAAYEFGNCRLLNEPMVAPRCLSSSSWHSLDVVMIGDSNILLQKEWMEKQTASLFSNDEKVVPVNLAMLEIWGGYWRCLRWTCRTNLTAFLHDNDSSDDYSVQRPPRVVVFNSGLHEITRLCAREWNDERRLYLTEAERAMSCTALYRLVIRDFVATITSYIPATVYIFQTTTAAWPKYGNFGIEWNAATGQALPHDAAFVERFNDIAISEIQSLNRNSKQQTGKDDSPPFIHVVDAYWMTLARPDNREVGGIGRKLSHPSLEVLSYMVRLWWQVAIQQLCASLT